MADYDTMNKEISVIISKDMHLFGTCSLSTRVRKEAAILSEFMLGAIGMRFIYGGAVVERTTTVGSDVDKMLVIPDMIGYDEGGKLPVDMTGHVFMMDKHGCSPGYTKLKLTKRKGNDIDIFTAFNMSIDDFLVSHNGDKFLSSEKFVSSMFMCGLGRGVDLPVTNESNFFRHGPCATCTVKDNVGHAFGRPVALDNDTAYGIPCLQWPEEAGEWKERRRPHGWPQQQTIFLILKQACHLVPVGDKTSKYPDLEWRVSFLAGERELVWTFNDTQLQCYVILKNILKGEIGPLAPDNLSSFHLKTIMFWLSEENPLDMWTDENLINCVQLGLRRLESSIRQGNLSHYFARRRNLLSSKLNNESDKTKVLNKITTILQQTLETILKSPGLETLLTIWTKCHSNRSMFIQLNEGVDNLYLLAKIEKENLETYTSLFCIYDAFTYYPFLFKDLLHIMIELDEYPPARVCDMFATNYRRFLNIRLGITFLKHERECNDYLEKVACIVTGRELFNDGSGCDALSGLLYLATFDMQCKKVGSSLEVLKRACRNIHYVCYSGWCSKKRGITKSGEMLKQILDMPKYSSPSEESVAFDVIFNASDIDFVPNAVQYECAFLSAGNSTLRFHPVVYMYYLFFLSSFALKKSDDAAGFLNYLRKTIDDCTGGIERSRALNLLGYCYVLSDNVHEALKAFTMSIRETHVKEASKTVALYHIGLIFFNQYKNGNQLSFKQEDITILYEKQTHATHS